MRPIRNGDVLLRLANVSKSYAPFVPLRRKKVLSGVSLEVHSGEVVALTGENGSGKSTVIKIAAGLIRPDGGSVQKYSKIGYCPQEITLFDKLSVNETISLFGAAYNLEDETMSKRRGWFMDQFKMEKYAAYQIGQLSEGTRRKLNLIVAMLGDADLLLLDEPYAGFDYASYETFWKIVQQMVSEKKGVLMVSHIIREKENFAANYYLKDGMCTELGVSGNVA